MEMISSYTADGLRADEIFGMMFTYLSQGNEKDLIPMVNAIYAFEITKTKGQGTVKKGKPAAADATFTMTDADFDLVCLGKLNPQMAFMQGKMKIKGNMAKATKFTPELFLPPPQRTWPSGSLPSSETQATDSDDALDNIRNNLNRDL